MVRCGECLNRLGAVVKNWKQSEDGNVALLVAFSMVALCGFSAIVLDAGDLYIQHQRIQSAADAGALAGADALLQGADVAASTAYQYAHNNAPAGDFSAAADTSANEVTVTASDTEQLWFARVLGIPTATVRAKSKAVMGTLSSAVGLVPIAVPQQVFTFGQEVFLTDGAGGGNSGNYGFLDFSGNGSKGLRTDILQGFDFPLSVGDQVATKPGDTAQIGDAVTERISEDTDPDCSTFNTARPDCKRVVYLPVVNTLDVSGKKDVTILGFAAFYLEGVVGNGGHEQIQGRFIRMIRPGTVGSGQDFGTYSVRLTHS